MRKMIFAFVMTMACMMSVSAQSVDALFKEYKDKPGVEFVNIPKALMSMAKGFVKKDAGGEMVKKIESVRILNVNDNNLRSDFVKKAMKLKDNGYETMVNSNEDNEKALILVKTKSNAITEMVILNIESTECALIQLKGKFKASDINKMNF